MVKGDGHADKGSLSKSFLIPSGKSAVQLTES